MSQFHQAGQPVPGCYPSSASRVQGLIEGHRAIVPIQTAEPSAEALANRLWHTLDRVNTILERPPAELSAIERLAAVATGLVVAVLLDIPIRPRFTSPTGQTVGPVGPVPRGLRKKNPQKSRRRLN